VIFNVRYYNALIKFIIVRCLQPEQIDTEGHILQSKASPFRLKLFILTYSMFMRLRRKSSNHILETEPEVNKTARGDLSFRKLISLVLSSSLKMLQSNLGESAASHRL
jgi:hypothetical protein